MSKTLQTLNFTDTFADRHIGPRPGRCRVDARKSRICVA